MIVVEQIDSQHLAGNAIGDPSRRDLVVYLPPGYHTSTRRYPTAYLLHGFSSRAIHWTSDMLGGGVLYRAIDPVLDEVVSARRAAEMIVVMPDGWSKWGCSQWVDSPVNGNFEQYVAREVVAHVDQHYRTIPAAASRGVFGISSGGLGAWHLGSRNPDVFAAMALLSADSYFDLTHRAWLYRYYNNVFPGEPRGPVSGDEYSWLAYGLGSCYTPNVDNPPYYVDLPIEFPSGALIEPLWERWLSYDPVVSWRARRQPAPHARHPARRRVPRPVRPADRPPHPAPRPDGRRRRARFRGARGHPHQPALRTHPGLARVVLAGSRYRSVGRTSIRGHFIVSLSITGRVGA